MQEDLNSRNRHTDIPRKAVCKIPMGFRNSSFNISPIVGDSIRFVIIASKFSDSP